MDKIQTGAVTVHGLTIEYRERGTGPLMLCLHGFPDTPATFDALADHFAPQGWRVVTPWLRGYRPPVPAAVPQTALLAQDLLDLIDALGHQTAVVVGHDWGSTIATAAALLEPAKISRLVTLAVPYGTMKRALATDYRQQKRSWYMAFFLTPMAERAVAAADFAFLERLWEDWSVRVPRRELALAKEAFRQPGVLGAALDYYRCLFQPARHDPAYAERQARLDGRVGVPTLHLHGSEDGCGGVELLEGMEAFFEAPLTKVVVPGAGHFVHLEKPAEVFGAIERFLNRPSQEEHRV